MLKNITLSAEKSLIDEARRVAEEENTTLNAEFRRWLTQYVQQSHPNPDLTDLMDRLSYSQPGQKFTRGELNER
jgi:hypothetical protein